MKLYPSFINSSSFQRVSVTGSKKIWIELHWRNIALVATLSPEMTDVVFRRFIEQHATVAIKDYVKFDFLEII